MARMGWASALLGVLVFFVQASGVAAQDIDARAEFERGQAAYQQGDFDRALEAWQRAYDADPRPLLLYNISQALERLGRLDQAAAALETYLDRAEADDQYQATARARLASLRERLSQTGILIVGAPDGATIVVDGEPHSRTPRPDLIRLPPGSHEVDLRLEGYRDFHAAVVVPAGQTVEVRAAMEPSDGEGGAEGSSIVPIVLMGAGGAVVVTGAILGAVALGSAKDAPDAEGDDADGARALALVADVLFGLGAAAAVTGLVLLLMDGSGDEPQQDVAGLEVGPLVGDGTAGAMIGGRF